MDLIMYFVKTLKSNFKKGKIKKKHTRKTSLKRLLLFTSLSLFSYLIFIVGLLFLKFAYISLLFLYFC